MRVCLFEEVSGGHRPTFIGGLAAALLRRGHSVVGCLPPELRNELSDPVVADGIEWYPVGPADALSLEARRRQVRAVGHFCRQRGVELFCDLSFERNVLRLAPRQLEAMRHVHIVHRIPRFTYSGRSLGGKVLSWYTRRRARALARKGARFVVHTARSREVLSRFLPSDRIVSAGLPVNVESSAESVGSGHLDIQSAPLLFVGRIRPGRGFEVLLEALDLLGKARRLQVVGRQDAQVEESLTARYPQLPLEWRNRFVSDDELVAAYRRSVLVVLPYSEEFGDSGSASLVLLEALSHGRPVVVTPSLGPQLPAGYGGARVVDGHGALELATTLEEAIEELPVLLRAAAASGPEWVARHHSQDEYVKDLLGDAPISE